MRPDPERARKHTKTAPARLPDLDPALSDFKLQQDTRGVNHFLTWLSFSYGQINKALEGVMILVTLVGMCKSYRVLGLIEDVTSEFWYAVFLLIQIFSFTSIMLLQIACKVIGYYVASLMFCHGTVSSVVIRHLLITSKRHMVILLNALICLS